MMNQSAAPWKPSTQDGDQGLKRALILSAAFHLIAVAAFTLRMVFYPADMTDLQDSIRVDMVDLPTKQASLPPEPAKEAPPAPAEPPKKAEPPPPAPAKEVAKPKLPPPKPVPDKPKVDLNKTKQDQAAALKRLEALQKIQNMMKNKPSESTAPAAPPQPVRGNVVTSGNALTGIARMEHQSYLGTIKNSVKSQWNLPGWMANANLSARVRLYLDSNGNVVKKMISKSSGNEEYDTRALGAVEAASPLPAPPSSLTGVLAVDGIEIELVPD